MGVSATEITECQERWWSSRATARPGTATWRRPPHGSGPGVIVLQEWWGLVDHIRDVADRFAAEGFVALAPDLYHGESTTSPDDAGKLMMGASTSGASRRTCGALSSTCSGARRSPRRMSARWASAWAGSCPSMQPARTPRSAPASSSTGIHPNVQPRLSALEAPVLGFFAERDAFVPPEAGAAARAGPGGGGQVRRHHRVRRRRSRVLQRYAPRRLRRRPRGRVLVAHTGVLP